METTGLRCSKCWESKCNHWQHVVLSNTTLIKKGIFGTDKVQKEVKNFIQCKCGYEQELILKHANKFKCAKCDLEVIYLVDVFTYHQMKTYFRKVPRNKCQKCHGKGAYEVDKFIKCENCCGQGGILCRTCHFSGQIFTNSVNRAAYSDDLIVSTCNTCTGSGFSNICRQCDGNKLLISGKSPKICDCVE